MGTTRPLPTIIKSRDSHSFPCPLALPETKRSIVIQRAVSVRSSPPPDLLDLPPSVDDVGDTIVSVRRRSGRGIASHWLDSAVKLGRNRAGLERNENLQRRKTAQCLIQMWKKVPRGNGKLLSLFCSVFFSVIIPTDRLQPSGCAIDVDCEQVHNLIAPR
jgi:hypothetical protein